MDIQEFVENFDFISFNFVRRESNQLAHRLAKVEGECKMFQVWRIHFHLIFLFCNLVLLSLNEN